MDSFVATLRETEGTAVVQASVFPLLILMGRVFL